VVELVTNAIKYAYGGGKGVVWVTLVQDADTLLLAVRDDGCGLPPGFAPQKSSGLGMRIVVALATQLNAELNVQRADKGALFNLRLPLLSKAP
jgi:two-component sensor histidine kinase